MSELFRPGTEQAKFRARVIPEIKGGSPVASVEDYFAKREVGGKPIQAATEFTNRLIELSEGRRVPVVIFNCLDFRWQKEPGSYPNSVIEDDASLSNAPFFRDNIAEYRRQLQSLGDPQVTIIVPDSELFDARPFSFAQDVRTRAEVGVKVLETLESIFPRTEVDVLLWNEYCERYGTETPEAYTTINYQKILGDTKLDRKVRDQAKDSRKYLVRAGLDEEYVAGIQEDEMIERTRWYLAMYAGEGQALAESKAIVINLEDSRVASWYQRGADGKLPILTPTDPIEWYRWRNKIKGEA